QAERVNDFRPGRRSEGEQVIDPAKTVGAGAHRDALVYRAAADPQVTQAQGAEQGDERVVLRAEQVAPDAGVAGIERPHLEAQSGEAVRDIRPRRPRAPGDRHGRGSLPGPPGPGTGVRAPGVEPAGRPA